MKKNEHKQYKFFNRLSMLQFMSLIGVTALVLTLILHYVFGF